MTQSLKKPRIQRDWLGCRVELVNDCKRGDDAILPAGLQGVVVRTGTGFKVQFDACTCCGISLSGAKIRPEMLNILAFPEKKHV